MPEGLSSALSSIGPELQVGLGAAGLGSTAYNMYNQYQNQQYQNQLRSYAQDPAKMNQYAAQFTQPLNAGLNAAVANNTQGYLAQRGLSDSPQIAQQVQAQAIAPYVQQNQQQGYQDALQALQVGGGAVNPNLNSPNAIANLAKAFSTLNNATGLAKIQQLASLVSAPQTIPQGADRGSLYGGGIPWTDTTLSGTMMPDMSGLFPGQPSVTYTPDYFSGIDTAGGGDPSLGVLGDYGG